MWENWAETGMVDRGEGDGCNFTRGRNERVDGMNLVLRRGFDSFLSEESKFQERIFYQFSNFRIG